MVSSAIRHSSTVDEQTHLFRGAAYLIERATHFHDVHPPVSFALNALPLLTEPELSLPVDEPAWDEGRWELAAGYFLWRDNADPLRLIFLGRLPTIWFTLFLGALLFRWGGQLGGRPAAIVALILFLFDPNVLAHGQLITNDITLTLWLTLALYAYWRWAMTGRATLIVALGVALGLAAATKYSAVTVVPVLVALASWLAWRRRSWRPLLALIPAGIIASLLLWGSYGFQIQPFPLAPVWADLQWTLDYLQQPPITILLLHSRPGGWWYYFPIAFLVKTPLATLALVATAVAATVQSVYRRRQPSGMTWTSWLALVLFPLFYFAVSLVGPFQIGYRHLLPMTPFVVLFTSVSLLGPAATGARARRAAVVLAATLPFLSLVVWPDYIPYFNVLAGGPGRQRQILSDSNIDWGQDLPALAKWNETPGADQPLYLSYFGTAHPSAYGVEFIPLPTWPPTPEQAPPSRQLYDPRAPAPGLYAISVTNLHGHLLDNQGELFAQFRDQAPLAVPGGSIRVYEVAADGPPYAIAFAGLTPAGLVESLSELLPGNDRRVRWMDDAEALIWSPDGLWLASAFDMPTALRALLPPEPPASSGGQALYWLPQPPNLPWATQSESFGGVLTYQGAQVTTTGDEIEILTAWDVIEPTDRPLKIFIHTLDPSGQIAAQWDGLSLDPTTLEPGDTFVQRHRLNVPQIPQAALVVGVYDGETLERLTLADGRDRIMIGGTP
jgi:hypothetical protein